MGIGKRVLQLRLQSKMTQQEISALTGLAVSYLSRLENEKITPSIRTLNRIAGAFGVEVGRLLEGEPQGHDGESCPVSPSGHCLLSQLSVGRGRKPKAEAERYSPSQLEILRMCNLVFQTEDRQIVETLSTLLKSLLELAAKREEPAAHWRAGQT